MKCDERVWARDGRGGDYPCGRPAKHPDGKCGIHTASAKAAREEKSRAYYAAEQAKSDRRYKRLSLASAIVAAAERSVDAGQATDELSELVGEYREVAG